MKITVYLTRAGLALLRPLLISQRNQSIEALERKYSEQIGKLLAFKMEILKRIQRHRQEMKHLTESPRRASRPDTVQ